MGPLREVLDPGVLVAQFSFSLLQLRNLIQKFQSKLFEFSALQLVKGAVGKFCGENFAMVRLWPESHQLAKIISTG